MAKKSRSAVQAHMEKSVGTHPVKTAHVKAIITGHRVLKQAIAGKTPPKRTQSFMNPAPGDQGATNAMLYQSGAFGPHGQ